MSRCLNYHRKRDNKDKFMLYIHWSMVWDVKYFIFILSSHSSSSAIIFDLKIVYFIELTTICSNNTTIFYLKPENMENQHSQSTFLLRNFKSKENVRKFIDSELEWQNYFIFYYYFGMRSTHTFEICPF